MSEFQDADVETLHAMGYAQELARRISGFSNFAISFSIICVVAGGITSFPLALSTGGGFSVAIGWLVGGLFAFIVAAVLAQIGSAFPTAGGLYHWASILGGRGWGWATAWLNLFGLVFVVAAVNVGVFKLLQGMVAPMVGIDSSAWGFREQTIAVVVISISQGLFNHVGIEATSRLTDCASYLIVGIVFALTATFLIWGAGLDLTRLFTFANNTGAAGGYLVPEPRSASVAFLVSLLFPLFTLTGFDASAHTSEETVNARVSVPLGILNSVFWSVVFGFVMVASFVLASPDLEATAKDGANAWFNLFSALAAPKALKSVLTIAIVVANYLCGLACLTSFSRMIFAFARDGGLPASNVWRKVSAKWRTPAYAVWLGVGLAIASTLYSPAYAALAAGCALFLYASYAVPIAVGLMAIGKTWTEFGPFNLGAWFRPLALIAVLGSVVLAYAGLQPPNDVVADYALAAAGLLLVLWFGLERNRFRGPPQGAAILERRASILREEEAVGEVG